LLIELSGSVVFLLFLVILRHVLFPTRSFLSHTLACNTHAHTAFGGWHLGGGTLIGLYPFFFLSFLFAAAAATFVDLGLGWTDGGKYACVALLGLFCGFISTISRMYDKWWSVNLFHMIRVEIGLDVRSGCVNWLRRFR
jgi:hypothetical protein